MPIKKKKEQQLIRNKAYRESPSSRIVCSWRVQSRAMPGLCFMASAVGEASGAKFPLNDDATWVVCSSSWFPEGLAIEFWFFSLSKRFFFARLNESFSTRIFRNWPIRHKGYLNWHLVPANYRITLKTYLKMIHNSKMKECASERVSVVW